MGSGWSNKPHTTIQNALNHINFMTFAGQPAYFAMATFEKEQVWDHAANNGAGKYRFRTQANAQFIKSFFLDLDVDPEDPKKFSSKQDAVAKLKAFVHKIGLPPPMIVDSGGGIHAYWPLFAEVSTVDWRPVADKLKAICNHEEFNADRSLTSDQARVLRCLGGFNTRRGAPVHLLHRGGGPYDFADIARILDGYIVDSGLPPVRRPAVGHGGVAAPANAFFDDNLGATNDPGNFDRIVYHCNQLASQVNARGNAVGEVIWRAALGVAKFCESAESAYRALSEGHSDYSWSGTLAKVEGWHTGPATCQAFETENPAGCQGCPFRGEIKSPISLGRERSKTPEPMAPVQLINDLGEAEEVFIAPRPTGYHMKGTKLMVEAGGDVDGLLALDDVCPYDLYPIRIMRQSGMDILVEERSMWRAHLPRLGPTDMEIPQSLISDHRKLYSYLMQKGVYMTDDNAKATQRYMSFYLQTLAEAADRDKLYERMGWHDDHKSFVLGNKVIYADGKMRQVNPSKTVRAVTKDGAQAAGSAQAWKDAMAIYNQPGYEGTRFFIYAALGAPLFHMNDTGNKGVLITASGESGRGKTTALKACASLWGKPDNLIMNGNKEGSTVNALYETLGCYHSLPFLWDDITERDPEEIRRFLLNISQGRGKDRMKGAEHVGKTVTWETIVLASANTDDVSRILSSGRDVSPHLMRMIGVPFGLVNNTPAAKLQADNFLRAINQNHGHAGPLMMKFVVQHYDKVAKGYIKNIAMVDQLLNSKNAAAERYWSAAVAAAYTAAQIASTLGLIDYPYEEDLKWMVQHLSNQREDIQDHTADPLDVLVEFLETHIGNTLVVSAKNSSNLDCTVVKPYHALTIRHEMDASLIYISRQAVMDYCAEKKMPFRRMEQMLESTKVLLNKNRQKVLGADTVYAKGQTRCWEIDADQLGVPVPAVPTQPSGSAKVVSISKGKAA
jgi:hypothetical protein